PHRRHAPTPTADSVKEQSGGGAGRAVEAYVERADTHTERWSDHAAGDIDWLVSVDSTVVRAHQHSTGGKKGHSTGTKRVITPSADPAAD
ncbi:hypothetical protein RZ50_028070, partial [Kitasatospora sp. SUK 42]|nr:hypothetical protein [Kitasatospora sp. SUK 42]